MLSQNAFTFPYDFRLSGRHICCESQNTFQADKTYGHNIVGHLYGRLTILYLYVDTEGPFIYILSNYGRPYHETPWHSHPGRVTRLVGNSLLLLGCNITVFTNSCIRTTVYILFSSVSVSV